MARVLLFGPLRDLAGWRERELPADSVRALRAVLNAADPRLGAAIAAGGVRVAVDQAIIAGADAPLYAGSEVAFLPPMSGG